MLLQFKIMIGVFSQFELFCHPKQEHHEKWVELNIFIWITPRKGRCVLKKTLAKVCQYSPLIKGNSYRETHIPGIIIRETRNNIRGTGNRLKASCEDNFYFLKALWLLTLLLGNKISIRKIPHTESTIFPNASSIS